MKSGDTVSGRNVLDLLGISDEDGSLERDRVALFVAKKELDEGDALQRIKWMMAVYRRWIEMKEAAQSGRCGFVEAVTVGMEGLYQFGNLLSDFQFILKNKHLLIEDEQRRAQNENVNDCDAADCFILGRALETYRVGGLNQK